MFRTDIILAVLVIVGVVGVVGDALATGKYFEGSNLLKVLINEIITIACELRLHHRSGLENGKIPAVYFECGQGAHLSGRISNIDN